jgi:DNA-binding response OmpR family regulator
VKPLAAAPAGACEDEAVRILIADDNEALALGLAHVLEQSGHVVEAVSDGQATLEAIGRGRFELLVLDYGMPRLDGAQVLRQVRARPDYLPVLLASAHDDAARRLADQGLAVDAVLTKPFSINAFESLVEELERGICRAHATRHAVHFGPLHCDPVAGRATIDGVVLELHDAERRLLERLASHHGEAVGAAELAPLASEPLEPLIERLRQRLEATPLKLVAVRGIGWCLAVDGPAA